MTNITVAPPIQRNDPLPYYAQLAKILRDEIVSGRWAPGDALPSEAELGEFFALSRTAVRQALDVLVAEGRVHKEKGRGTVVARPKIAEFVVQELRGFHEEMTQRGKRVETEVLTQHVGQVPPHVAQALEVAMGSDAVHLQRLRRVDGEPVVLVDTYLPAPRFAALAGHALTNTSLYAVLIEHFAVEPAGGVRSIEAELPDEYTAAKLGVSVSDPILRLDAINLDADGAPFEWFRARYRGDATTFTIWLESKT